MQVQTCVEKNGFHSSQEIDDDDEVHDDALLLGHFTYFTIISDPVYGYGHEHIKHILIYTHTLVGFIAKAVNCTYTAHECLHMRAGRVELEPNSNSTG